MMIDDDDKWAASSADRCEMGMLLQRAGANRARSAGKLFGLTGNYAAAAALGILPCG